MRTRMEVPVRPGLLRTVLLRAMIAALCAAPAACPAFAQEGAPAAAGGSGDSTGAKAPAADGATPANHDAEPFTPQSGLSGLQRRAGLKALIANARSKAAALPSATVRTGPLPGRPGIEAATQRNAIGVALPGARPLDHGVTGVAKQAGITGTPAGTTFGVRQTPVPNAGQALRGGGLNGSAMGRMGSVSGSIGGPAKDRSGINGTLVPQRR